MNWQAFEVFAHNHKDGLELFGLALIVTMRRTLPWPFSLAPPLVWAYEWSVDALMTLVSLKGPLPHAAGMQSTEKTVTDGQHSESLKEMTVSGAVAAPEAPQPVAAPEIPLAKSGIERDN